MIQAHGLLCHLSRTRAHGYGLLYAPGYSEQTLFEARRSLEFR